MKHKMKRHSSFSAYCIHPGCTSGIEGSWYDGLPDVLIKGMETDGCPCVYIKGKDNPTHKESVDYLLKYARKEIKDWEKLIKFWENK